ncbi:DUF1638 domain-containing protein [Jannaschia aquimarina]|uniref:DUF1638 domain-containing protein n=1 Tax=Jannaschia aquimarina TaxID=935700 RepID=A0A0D1ENJ0_9RHOB|nr:DUF1638 domain-containing protein [Jannaschia aquimarina]KIT17230.1 hypothetical protein jaqu_09610 [Jannaschia aquimarina]SNT18806.1 Protein of unknown function [Jannaschia aquimarina]
MNRATPPPSIDDVLTTKGLPPTGEGRVLILACGALAREIRALLDCCGLTHIDLQCLPAILHNHPDRIAPAVEAALVERTGYATRFVAYGDCGTGGALAKVCAVHGVEMIDAPHCYAFYEGPSFAVREEIDAFYLTDFLARQFDAFVTRPLGLDRHPVLRDSYFGNYARLVYLAQTDDPALDAKARAAADTLGLAYERRATGLGPLAQAIGPALHG